MQTLSPVSLLKEPELTRFTYKVWVLYFCLETVAAGKLNDYCRKKKTGCDLSHPVFF